MAKQQNTVNYSDNIPTPTSNQQALKKLQAEATAKKIPAQEDETPSQRADRMRQQLAEEQKVKSQKEFYKSATQHPDFANKLYNIREASQDDPIKPKVELRVDDEGHPYARIYKQMDGAIGFDFSIHDGKIVFNTKLDDDKMAEILDFLYRRGITNYELPQGVDKNFIETFNKVKEQKLGHYATASVAADSKRKNDTSNITLSDPIDKDKITPKGWKNPNTVEKKGLDKAIEDFESWVTTHQQKKLGLSCFKNEALLNGTCEFSIYNSEDPNNYENDGKKDKNGVVKETCAYRIKLFPRKNKETGEKELGGIHFHVPNGGKFPDAVADRLALIVKNQGAAFMNFPQGLSQINAGVFRTACARAGIIPTGIGISHTHADSMVAEAEKALGSTEEKLKFKYNLACQMERNSSGKDSDEFKNKIAALKGEYNFHPLKKHFENIICPEINNKVKGNKAEEVLGSAKAAEEIYSIYDASHSATFGELINSNLIDSESKKRFLDTLNKNDITPSSNTSIRDLNSTQMKALFNALEVKHTKEATQILIETTNGLNKKDADTEIRKLLGDAKNSLSEITKNFDEKNLKGIRVPYLGNPSFKNPNMQQNNRKPMLQQPREIEQ